MFVLPGLIGNTQRNCYDKTAAGGGGSATSTYTDHAESASDLTTYTFATLSFGATAADRKIVACVGGHDTGAVTTISSVTIGGVAATLVVGGVDTTDGNSLRAAMYIADVPTGTTGDVVVTFSQAIVRAGCVVHRLVGAASSTASDTGVVVQTEPASDTLTVPANGTAIGYWFHNGLHTVSWTNMTERLAKTAIESAVCHGTASVDSAGGGSIAFTATSTGTGAGNVVLFATWGP